METIVINVENKLRAKQILDAIKLFNGVANAAIATDEELENLSILKECKAARKIPKSNKAEVLSVLK